MRDQLIFSFSYKGVTIVEQVTIRFCIFKNTGVNGGSTCAKFHTNLMQSLSPLQHTGLMVKPFDL